MGHQDFSPYGEDTRDFTTWCTYTVSRGLLHECATTYLWGKSRPSLPPQSKGPLGERREEIVFETGILGNEGKRDRGWGAGPDP